MDILFFLAAIILATLLACVPPTTAFARTSFIGTLMPRGLHKYERITIVTAQPRSQAQAEPNAKDGGGAHDSDPNDDNDGNDSDGIPYRLKNRNPYDVHVYYDGDEERAAAMTLRAKLRAKFGDWMRFYPPRDAPIGPHPLPMWEADFGSYVNRHRWREVRDFLVSENAVADADADTVEAAEQEQEQPQPQPQPQPLSILIHPHSTDGDYADHTRNAFWTGRVLDLRISGWDQSVRG